MKILKSKCCVHLEYKVWFARRSVYFAFLTFRICIDVTASFDVETFYINGITHELPDWRGCLWYTYNSICIIFCHPIAVTPKFFTQQGLNTFFFIFLLFLFLIFFLENQTYFKKSTQIIAWKQSEYFTFLYFSIYFCSIFFNIKTLEFIFTFENWLNIKSKSLKRKQIV